MQNKLEAIVKTAFIFLLISLTGLCSMASVLIYHASKNEDAQRNLQVMNQTANALVGDLQALKNPEVDKVLGKYVHQEGGKK